MGWKGKRKEQIYGNITLRAFAKYLIFRTTVQNGADQYIGLSLPETALGIDCIQMTPKSHRDIQRERFVELRTLRAAILNTMAAFPMCHH